MSEIDCSNASPEGEKEFSELAIVPGSPESPIRSNTSPEENGDSSDLTDFARASQSLGLGRSSSGLGNAGRNSEGLGGFGRNSEGLESSKYWSHGTHRSRPSVRSCVGHQSSLRSHKKDACSLLSAKTIEDLSEILEEQHHTHPPLEPSYPLPLVIFVALLSVIGGLVVTGVHLTVVYAGCPLGVNGCNSFTPSKESKGFFFIKWVKRVTNDAIPEDVIYIVFSIIGACIVSAIFTFTPEHLSFQIRGGGTIQSLVAVATGERILLTAALLRLVSTSIYLGSGGTLGLDGPAIQVCTAVTTFLGYLVGMRSVPTQSLLACLGFAGGFAATFNSPLAGIMFAMEELQHVSSRLSKHIICVILMASIVATLVARALLFNQQLVDTNWSENLIDSVSGGSLGNVIGTKMWMLVAVPIGILSSFAGFACSRAIRWMHTVLRYLRPRVPEPAIFIVHSFMVACIGSVVFRSTGLRGVWGIGYESLQESFNRKFYLWEYLIVTVGKLLAMVLAVCARSPGDILEPVLISGAFLGGSVGAFLQEIITDANLSSQVMRPCLVFGMVGLFASCFRFPITPVVIVLELMGVETYALVLPAALSGFTAITASNRLFPPLLDEIMHEDEIDLHVLSQEADGGTDDMEVLNWMEQGIMGDLENLAAETADTHNGEQESESNGEGGPDVHPPPPGLGIAASRRTSGSTATSQSSTTTKSTLPTPKRSTSMSIGNMFTNIEATVLSLSEAEGSQVYNKFQRRKSLAACLGSPPGGNGARTKSKEVGNESVGDNGFGELVQRLSLMKQAHEGRRSLDGVQNGRLSLQGLPRRASAAGFSHSRNASVLAPSTRRSVTSNDDTPSPTSSHQLLMDNHMSALRAAVQNANMTANAKDEPSTPPSRHSQKKNSKGFRASFLLEDGQVAPLATLDEDQGGKDSMPMPGEISSPPPELEEISSRPTGDGVSHPASASGSEMRRIAEDSAACEQSEPLSPKGSGMSIN